MPKYIRPKVMGGSFTCPHCDVTAKQRWYANARAYAARGFAYGTFETNIYGVSSCNDEIVRWGFSECDSCGMLSVWHGETLVFPSSCSVMEPSVDMPDDVRALYLEAASVLNLSPRSAAALLRLALQKLLNQVLGDEAKSTIDANIKLLKEKYASASLIKALDVIRVFGNESVHPGTIILEDSPDDAEYLFVVLNMIVEQFFTQQRRLEELFEQIPEQKRNV